MASIIRQKTDSGIRYSIQLSPGENYKRPKIALGKVTRKEAQVVQTHIENLLKNCKTGAIISLSTQDWLMNLPEPLRDRLEKLGLVEAGGSKDKTTLSGWIDGYIKGRRDVKPSTKTAMTQATVDLYEFWGRDGLVVDFTQHDAENFRIYLLGKKLAESTVRRRCKYAKQFFAAAIKKRILSENPFDAVPVAGRISTDRQRFISQDEIGKVIEACPNAQWRLIFAMSRYGGLRIPSELFGLTWDDIIWDKKRFVIHSPKTEHIEGKATRTCPLFPELEPYLLEVFEQSETGQHKVITEYDEKNKNLRTTATKIIQNAGVTVWPKLFQNLRSSRETELVEKFPIHVVTAWLGNSPDVAHKHYLQTHEEHFKKAVHDPVHTGDVLNGTDLHGENEAIDDSELSTCGATGYNTNKKGAIHQEPHPLVPRGFEPLLPG